MLDDRYNATSDGSPSDGDEAAISLLDQRNNSVKAAPRAQRKGSSAAASFLERRGSEALARRGSDPAAGRSLFSGSKPFDSDYKRKGSGDLASVHSMQEMSRVSSYAQQEGAYHTSAGAPNDSDYLYDFYTGLLEELRTNATEMIQGLVHQEMEVRRRLYALANADMVRVRFVEEARWELRERHDVIIRRERLERSRLEKELLDAVRVHMLGGSAGAWCEDAKRAAIEELEEREIRQLLNYHRGAVKGEEERRWEEQLAREDKWRWEVELAVRHGIHEVQVEEHRHRAYLETDLYPSNLNKLLRAMELEWVNLLKMQTATYHVVLNNNFSRMLKEEEDRRQYLLRTNARVVNEFNVLHSLLEFQHAEEMQRKLLEDTALRLFAIVYSRETVQQRALVERTRMMYPVPHVSHASALDPRFSSPQSVGLALDKAGAVDDTRHWQLDERCFTSPPSTSQPPATVTKASDVLDRKAREYDLEQRLNEAMHTRAPKYAQTPSRLGYTGGQAPSSLGTPMQAYVPREQGSMQQPSAKSASTIGMYRAHVPKADIEAAAALLQF
ncbi:hypothetical protein DIPPA_01882 [Diplonema papillatum]|nr:hypothetical protein DIPPA_01882 [Diplonema papillatum]